MTAKEKVVVILGPTATGKTACGILLAQKLKGEIISGDSMLVFRGMDIATAKPTPQERALAVHHLIDVRDPEEKYSAFDFKREAASLIQEIHGRGHMPIIVGGTGLYLKALLENYHFSTSEEQTKRRQALAEYADRYGNEALHQKLEKLDEETANRLKINDRRRIIRAIEAWEDGDPVSQEKDSESPFDAVVFGLTMERALLYDRINRRVDLMAEEGLFDEARFFYDQGIPLDSQSMKSIGYRQCVQYFRGEWDKKTAVAKIKQATRNFAKRQITWYKKMPYIHWLMLDASPHYPSIADKMLEVLRERQFIEK